MNSLQFMKTPERWPLWPVLPLRNQSRLGYMLDCNNPMTVFVGLIYDRPCDCLQIEFLSYEAIIEDGWVVD